MVVSCQVHSRVPPLSRENSPPFKMTPAHRWSTEALVTNPNLDGTALEFHAYFSGRSFMAATC